MMKNNGKIDGEDDGAIHKRYKMEVMKKQRKRKRNKKVKTQTVAMIQLQNYNKNYYTGSTSLWNNVKHQTQELEKQQSE